MCRVIDSLRFTAVLLQVLGRQCRESRDDDFSVARFEATQELLNEGTAFVGVVVEIDVKLVGTNLRYAEDGHFVRAFIGERPVVRQVSETLQGDREAAERLRGAVVGDLDRESRRVLLLRFGDGDVRGLNFERLRGPYGTTAKAANTHRGFFRSVDVNTSRLLARVRNPRGKSYLL